jgi:hypothetical protein
MRARRFLTVAIFGAALVPLAAGPANAAPPDNDEVAGAVVLHLGDQIQQDTTEATTNAGDAALNANCGAPATNASVWYQYTPTTKRNVVLDVSASDYSAGAMIFKGTPTADSLLACGPGAVGLRAKAGQTYYVMVFSDDAVNGGNLVLSLANAPTPSVHVAVAKRGTATHGGAATVHGTYSCTHADSFAEVDAHLLQRAGRLKIQADSGTAIQCDGKRHPWSVRLVSPVGTYARGHASTKVSIIACGLLECRQAKTTGKVQLSWASSSRRQAFTHPSMAPTARPRSIHSLYQHWPSI